MENQITPVIPESQTLLPTNTFSEEIHQKFPKIPADIKCNGKIHRQLRYCRKSAGWGTTHFGSGRCKLHGGCSTGPKSGNLRYSDFEKCPSLQIIANAINSKHPEAYCARTNRMCPQVTVSEKKK